MKKSVFDIPSAVIAALFLFLGSAGAYASGVQGSGDLAKKTFRIGDISSVDFGAACRLVITQGSETKLELITDKNLMNYFTVSDRGGTLRIDQERNVNGSKEPVFNLMVRDLTRLELSGSGTVESRGFSTGSHKTRLTGSGKIRYGRLTAKDVFLELTGSGTISVDDCRTIGLKTLVSGSGGITVEGSGVVDTLEAVITGSGTCDTSKLRALDVEARITGSGSLALIAENTLESVITGSGIITYSGSPSMDTNITGSGRIRKR